MNILNLGVSILDVNQGSEGLYSTSVSSHMPSKSESRNFDTKKRTSVQRSELALLSHFRMLRPHIPHERNPRRPEISAGKVKLVAASFSNGCVGSRTRLTY